MARREARIIGAARTRASSKEAAMAIMALFRSRRVDQSLYDAIIRELNPEQRPLAGILAHACGFDDNGICVMDVWESRSDFEAFLSDRLRPTFAKLNIEFTEPEIIEAYAFNVSDDADHYKPELAPTGARQSTGSDEQPSGTPH
jgi:hypothetical protein